MPNVQEVQIAFIKPQDGLIAFASLVLDGNLYLSGIGIHRKLDGTGYRLTYPTRKIGNAQARLFHPINTPTGKAIETAILEKLNDVLEKCDAGHHRPDAGTAAISD